MKTRQKHLKNDAGRTKLKGNHLKQMVKQCEASVNRLSSRNQVRLFVVCHLRIAGALQFARKTQHVVSPRVFHNRLSANQRPQAKWIKNYSRTLGKRETRCLSINRLATIVCLASGSDACHANASYGSLRRLPQDLLWHIRTPQL